MWWMRRLCRESVMNAPIPLPWSCLSNNDKVEAHAIAQSGFEAAVRSCAQHTGDLLAVEDTTTMSFVQRLHLPLATLDTDLREAARASGVPLLGMPEDSTLA